MQLFIGDFVRSTEEFQVWRTNREREFLHDGKVVKVPENWIFIPAGDPGLTRRLKKSGEYWSVVHKRKNRIEALGIWVASDRVQEIKNALETERQDLRKMCLYRLSS